MILMPQNSFGQCKFDFEVSFNVCKSSHITVFLTHDRAGRNLFDPIGKLPKNEIRRLARRGGNINAPFVFYSSQYEVGQVCYYHIWRKRVLGCRDVEELLVLIRVLSSFIDSTIVHRAISLARSLHKHPSSPRARVVCGVNDIRDGEQHFLVLDKQSRAKWIPFRELDLELLIEHRHQRRQKLIEESKKRMKLPKENLIHNLSKTRSPSSASKNKHPSSESKKRTATSESKNKPLTSESMSTRLIRVDKVKTASSTSAQLEATLEPLPRLPKTKQQQHNATAKRGRGRQPNNPKHDPSTGVRGSTSSGGTGASALVASKVSKGAKSGSATTPKSKNFSLGKDFENAIDQYNEILLDHQLAYLDVVSEENEKSEKKVNSVRRASCERLERLLSFLGSSIVKKRIMNTIILCEESSDVFSCPDENDVIDNDEKMLSSEYELGPDDARSPKQPPGADKKMSSGRCVPPKLAPISKYMEQPKRSQSKPSVSGGKEVAKHQSPPRLQARHVPGLQQQPPAQMKQRKPSVSGGKEVAKDQSPSLLQARHVPGLQRQPPAQMKMALASHKREHKTVPSDAATERPVFSHAEQQPFPIGVPRQPPQASQPTPHRSWSKTPLSLFSHYAHQRPSLTAQDGLSSIQATPKQSALAAAQMHLVLYSQAKPQAEPQTLNPPTQHSAQIPSLASQAQQFSPPFLASGLGPFGQPKLNPELQSASQATTFQHHDVPQGLDKAMKPPPSSQQYQYFSGQKQVEASMQKKESPCHDNGQYMKDLVQNALGFHDDASVKDIEDRQLETRGQQERAGKHSNKLTRLSQR